MEIKDIVVDVECLEDVRGGQSVVVAQSVGSQDQNVNAFQSGGIHTNSPQSLSQHVLKSDVIGQVANVDLTKSISESFTANGSTFALGGMSRARWLA